MSRPLRIEYPGAVYHVMNRGNQRATVFHDDWHYAMFLDKLGIFADEFNIAVYAYCCMPNHFHLQLRTREANLSRFMQSFLTSFSISSNKKRHTSGHIFQGRFKSLLVEDECYRSRLSRYVHLNPVRTKSLRDATIEARQHYLREFRWSSYGVYLGTTKKPKWLDRSLILGSWSKRLRDQMRNYSAYVEEGLLRDVENPFDDVVEQSILGGDRFVDKVKREYLLLRSGNKGDEPVLVRLQQSYELDHIVTLVAQYYDTDNKSILTRRSGFREARRVAMHLASHYCRGMYSLKDLAAKFSVSGGALSQARDKVSQDNSPPVVKALKNLHQKIKTTS